MASQPQPQTQPLSTATPIPSPIALIPATKPDIPHLARISDRGSKKDAHTQMKALAGCDPNEHVAMMTGVLESWIERSVVLKAVLGDEVVGWACWAQKEGGDKGEGAKKKEEEEKEEGEEGEEGEKKDESKLEKLSSITNASMREWQTKLSPPGQGHMILVAIVVDPAFQRRGVGTALIGWGTQTADQRDVFCWVAASEMGWRVFERKEFVVVGSLQVDLDEFADGCGNPEAADGRWGLYTFRYMRRPSRSERDGGVGSDER